VYTVAKMISSDLEKLLNQLPEHMQGQVTDYVKSLLSQVPQVSQDPDVEETPKKGRKLDLHPGAMHMESDFDAPLEDEFWLQSK